MWGFIKEFVTGGMKEEGHKPVIFFIKKYD
jgi:hypothetical protein